MICSCVCVFIGLGLGLRIHIISYHIIHAKNRKWQQQQKKIGIQQLSDDQAYLATYVDI
jgi:hypothetical protein